MIYAGALLDAGEFAIHDWVPDFTTGITTMGVGTTATGWYTSRSGLVEAHFYVVFAGSPVFASTIAADLPVPGDYDGIQQALGSWVFRDSGDGYHYGGPIAIWSGANSDFCFSGCWDGTAPRSRVTHAKPFTVAAGDILSGELKYRSA